MYSCSISLAPRVVRPTPSMLPARGGIQRSSTTRSPSRISQQPCSQATSLIERVWASALEMLTHVASSRISRFMRSTDKAPLLERQRSCGLSAPDDQEHRDERSEHANHL